MKKYRGIITDGTTVKAIDPWDVDSMAGWTRLAGGDDERTATALYNQTAWLYGTIQKRASAARAIPFVIRTKAGAEVDDLPFKIDIAELMFRASIALDLYGRAYMWKERNRLMIKRVRWIHPSTIEVDLDEDEGLTGFTRVIGSTRKRIEYDANTGLSPDLVWVWLPGMQEEGPSTLAPADVAVGAAGVLRSIDAMADAFFDRGAISAHFITATNNPPEPEKDRIRDKLKRLFFGGTDTAYGVDVFSAGMEVQKVGSDPKDLMMPELDADNRRDIAAVFQTPEPLVTGDAGSMSRATLDRLTSNWINQVILPQAELIIDALNFHVLEPNGFEAELNAEALEVNQEEERQRAQAWSLYVSQGMNPETAAALLGIDVPEGLVLMSDKPVVEPNQPSITIDDDTELDPDEPPDDEKAIELRRLRQFVKNGRHLERQFHSDILTPAEIAAEVGNAQDAPFLGWQGYP